jgi:hypothetical protein
MTHKCDKEDILELIVNDLREIKYDIKSLLKFKWQVVGGAGIIGTVVAYIVNKYF